jgi:pyruvate dehydrogenase E2 component (dihydrolipoamide acetyltransferase)
VANTIEVKVPELGDFSDVPVIEIHVAKGDTVSVDDSLVTLESDKATMDVPSSAAGSVQDILVQIGDVVSTGSPILVLSPDESSAVPDLLEQQEPPAAQEPSAAAPPVAAPPVAAAPAAAPAPGPAPTAADFGQVHASPGVRRLARELDVDLTALTGTGDKGRITKDDIRAFLRGPAAAAPAAAATGAGIPEVPAQDYASFGPVETVPLSRIKKLSGPFLHRSWLNVPHVTHNDEADITETDKYRKELDSAAKAEGYRVTLLAFLIKASVSALRAYPEVNSSLSPEKDSLILKSYYNIGVAVDTPGGLVVPVVKDADRKGIGDISRELGALSATAREGKLTPGDMSGASFTISSLGGIGGTAFTPIVNAPEVAILGVVRSKTTPVWDGEAFQPRLMLPVSFSYDHRVIDGALAARFTRHLCHSIEDVRRLLL